MRRLPGLLAGVVVLGCLARPTPAPGAEGTPAAGPARETADTEVELRASTTQYRFVELFHSFDSGLLFDTLYTGEPGMDEIYLGLGYDLSKSPRASVTPILYAVFGKQYAERGATLGLLIYLEHKKTRFQTFAGHFFPTRGDVSAYSFVDSFDLTRVIGRWEVGVSAAAYAIEGDIVRVAGPTVKYNGRRGTWAASARAGDEREFRLIRTMAF